MSKGSAGCRCIIVIKDIYLSLRDDFDHNFLMIFFPVQFDLMILQLFFRLLKIL